MVPSYRGDLPYVYLCYSHSDGEELSYYLYYLVKDGVRVSFEPSMRAGAVAVMVILSKASLRDPAILSELQSSQADYENLILVHLDGSELSEADQKQFEKATHLYLNELPPSFVTGALESTLPPEVFPGPPKPVSRGN